MSNGRSTKVPKEWEAYYASLAGISDRFCQTHLNEEYAALARAALAALCRKRPSPLANGNPQTWVCAALYAVGQVNFLHDKASTPYMAMADLCAHFGIAASTGGNKAKLVRDTLGIRQFDHRWTLPGRLGSSPTAWMIEFNGFVVDARMLPMELQHAAVDKGLIPHVVSPAGPEEA